MMKMMLFKWKFVSGVFSLLLAACAYSAGETLVLVGDYLLAVYALYIGVVYAVAGIAAIGFSVDNYDAQSVILLMHTSVALPGVVIALFGRISTMFCFVVWSIVCTVFSVFAMRQHNLSKDI